MILTIRVDELLQLTLSRPSRDLVTRSTGAAIRGSIERAIAATSCPTTMLDFEWVGLIDFSCADEVVAKLLRVVNTDVYIVLRGIDETQAEAIDHVLSRQNLAVTAIPRRGGLQLLGTTTPDLDLAFQTVHQAGPGDASRLAGRLGWSLERAADALQTLAMRRLIFAGGGTFAPLPVQ